MQPDYRDADRQNAAIVADTLSSQGDYAAAATFKVRQAIAVNAPASLDPQSAARVAALEDFVQQSEASGSRIGVMSAKIEIARIKSGR